MFISEIHLENFRSFGSASLQLHPGVNVLVGRNGSGKSNLVEAVAFVLQGTKWNPQERQHLVHSGDGGGGGRRGTARPVARVRLILDNADRRLPLNDDRVEVSRTMGPVKEDALTLQGEKIKRDELQSLLEAAGFSRCNPYYIVRQGQVSELSSCSASRRLEVVRELTGDRGFEQGRLDAETTMAAAREELAEVDLKVHEMEARLGELGEDSDQLRKFQRLQRSKRAVDFLLAEKQSDHAKLQEQKALAEIEETWPLLREARKEVVLREAEAEKSARSKEKLMQVEQSERAAREETQEELMRQDKKIAELETRLEAYTGEIKRTRERMKEAKKEMSDIDREVERTEKELEAVQEEYRAAKESWQSLELIVAEKEKLQRSLYGNRGDAAGSRFRSEHEKEEWIRDRRAELGESRTKCVAKLQEMEEEARKMREKADQCLASAAKAEQSMSQISTEKRSLTAAQCNAEKEASGAIRNMAELVRAKSRQEKEVDRLGEKSKLAKEKLMKIGSVRQRFVGILSMQTLLDSLDEGEEALKDGVFGVVADYISPVEDMADQVDLIISEELNVRLFNVIIKDARTASGLLKKMRDLRLPGQLDFMPADKLLDVDFDRSRLPRSSKLLFDLLTDLDDPAVIKALRFLTCKTAVVDDPSRFPELQRIGLNGITLDGVKGSVKGVLRGGYLASGQCLVRLYRNFRQAEEELEEARAQTAELVGKLNGAATSRDRLIREAQDVKTKRERLEQQLVKTKDERNRLREMKNEFLDNVKNVEDAAHNLRRDLKETEAELKALSMSTGHSRERMNTQGCIDLAEELRDLKRQQRRAFQEKNAKEQRVVTTRNRLRENLYKRRADIEETVSDSQREEMEAVAATTKEELDNARQTQRQVAEDLKEADRLLEGAAQARLKYDKRDEECRSALERATAEQENLDAKQKKNLAKLDNLRENAAAESRGCEGTIPRDETERMKDWPRVDLFKESKKLARKLKRFKGVNTLAAEESTRLEEGLASFKDRRDKAIGDQEELKTLLANLEERRTAKVTFTHSQMKKYFAEIFKQLVPAGEANMIFESSDVASSTSSTNGLTGISLEVRFEGDEMLSDMVSLSGGQKAVVALAFIFAIQKCDPAPFFILDEVDAALDVRHRRRVVSFMRGQTDRQFLCTTFRRELLAGADRFVSVGFGHSESILRVVDRAEAERFITQEQQRQEEERRREEEQVEGRRRRKKSKTMQGQGDQVQEEGEEEMEVE